MHAHTHTPNNDTVNGWSITKVWVAIYYSISERRSNVGGSNNICQKSRFRFIICIMNICDDNYETIVRLYKIHTQRTDEY